MRKLILLVTALLPMAVMGQKSTLTLTLTGLEPGAGLVVSEALDGRLVPADTLYLDAKGTVKMTRQATEPIFFVLQPMTNRAAGLHCMLLPREIDFKRVKSSEGELTQFITSAVWTNEEMAFAKPRYTDPKGFGALNGPKLTDAKAREDFRVCLDEV